MGGGKLAVFGCFGDHRLFITVGAQMVVANLPDLTQKCKYGQIDEEGGLCRDSPSPFDTLTDEEIKPRLEASCARTSGSVRSFGGCLVMC